MLAALSHKFHCFVRGAEDRVLTRRRRRMAENSLGNFASPYKLHLGCGAVRFADWINIDQAFRSAIVDISWDITKPLPLPDGSCSFIYHEHLLEHLTVPQAVAFLSDCRRLLTPRGVMRVAMPSLEALCRRYVSENWQEQEWLRLPEYQFITRRAEMINVSFRWWGHHWLYDQEELHYRLHEAGFLQVRDACWGQSEEPDLRNRESRPDSLLICEARA